MPWTKSEATLGDGMQMVSGIARRVPPTKVPCYTYDCNKCGAEHTVLVTNVKEPVKVWCCGAFHSPEELLPKVGLLTRLLG